MSGFLQRIARFSFVKSPSIEDSVERLKIIEKYSAIDFESVSEVSKGEKNESTIFRITDVYGFAQTQGAT